ncbi:MAG: AAA family ATPase [Deltaproteobacteria bacterium]|jgi:MoxR-like ATPase|nr:AAA family ATPase [Deltaproteobacteria bacterium]MBW2537685.1 AAA family ATPase [Deltaproteobacteria bacterium]
MAQPLHARLRAVAESLQRQFIGKDEIIRLMLIAVTAGEHCVLLGPPGTAKSALIRTLSRMLQANYFEYLLTRFTEPNEIFGPVDIGAFREGVYRRNIEGMLPQAEIVFLDEIFKSNSAILNALLTLLNERKFASGGQVMDCPLISVFGASNEVPGDENLNAIFDRFLLRVQSDNLDAYHFNELLLRGIDFEVRQLEGAPIQPLVAAAEIAELRRGFGRQMSFSDDFLSTYKGLTFQIRAEGISLSDRRVIKLLKLFAASAFLDGRATADASDLFILKHIWNNHEQAALLDAIVQPVLDAFYRDNPDRRRVGAVGVGVEALEAEVDRIRQVITGGAALGDVQLFSQLKALGEIKSALSTLSDDRARGLERRVDQLLEASFQGGRFAQL